MVLPDALSRVTSTATAPTLSATLKLEGRLITEASSLSSIKTLSTPFGAESELAITVFTGLRAITLKTSSISSIASSIVESVTTLLVSPGAKVTVSFNALKSSPAIACTSVF